MIKILGIALLFSYSFHSNAFECSEPMIHNHELPHNELCPETTSNDEIFLIVESLIYNDEERLRSILPSIDLPDQPMFPELVQSYEDGKIKIREFTNDEYFLKTMFKLGHIFKKDRKMFLDINTKLYDCAPPKSALIGILAHELSHLQDYRKRGFIGAAGIGLRMITKKGRSRYERLTDLYIIKNNLSQGIKDYRNWIYKRLDKNQLKKKECFYYTPAEIDLYNLTGQDSMLTYFNNYCRR